MKKEANQHKWQTLLESQMSSGQTQVQWCAENSVNIHNFRYWKHRLCTIQTDTENPSIGFVSIKPAQTSSGSMRITVGAAMIEVNNSVNLSLLEDVLQVLMRYA